jgi:hypothetical protein
MKESDKSQNRFGTGGRYTRNEPELLQVTSCWSGDIRQGKENTYSQVGISWPIMAQTPFGIQRIHGNIGVSAISGGRHYSCASVRWRMRIFRVFFGFNVVSFHCYSGRHKFILLPPIYVFTLSAYISEFCTHTCPSAYRGSLLARPLLTSSRSPNIHMSAHVTLLSLTLQWINLPTTRVHNRCARISSFSLVIFTCFFLGQPTSQTREEPGVVYGTVSREQDEAKMDR